MSNRTNERISEDLADEARKVLDRLRSVQLYADLRILRQAYEAIRESHKNLRKHAVNLAAVHLEDYAEGQKSPRQSRFKLGKYEALVIIAVIAGIVAWVIFG